MIIKESGRPELTGGGICVGVSTIDRRTPIVSAPTLANLEAVCDLNRILNLFPGWPQDFFYTSIQINTGATDWHCDKANVDWSVSLSCGNFLGGELEFTDYSVNTFLTPTVFDGAHWHRTAAFEGERFAIVCFTHGLYGRLRTMYYDSC